MSGAPAASGGLRTALSYCVQQVHSYDYHNYLCLLHLPPSMRRAAFSFRAFNVETAKAMDVVSDPRKGLMRLLWWKDVIDKIYANKTVEHPVALALSSVLSEQKISKHWLKRSLEARINDGNRDEYAILETVPELERYVEDTQSTILYMTLQAGGIQSTVADHAASHIGKASGLLLLLKALPHHVSKQGTIPYIPASVVCLHRRVAGQRSGWVMRYRMQFSRLHLLPKLTCRRHGSSPHPCQQRRSPCSSQQCQHRSSWTPCDDVNSTSSTHACPVESMVYPLCGTSSSSTGTHGETSTEIIHTVRSVFVESVGQC